MKRIRVNWNRSQSPKTKYYEVYRSQQLNIEEGRLKDLLVARLEQVGYINPVTVVDEKVIRISESEYRLEHKNILIEFNGTPYDFTLVSTDGTDLPEFRLNLDTGVIEFDEAVSFDDTLRASYTFDGMAMWDYAIAEKGKTYYGPEAKDNSKPTTPQNVQLIPMYGDNKIRIAWDPVDATGITYYYRVRAFENENLYSRLSDYRSGTILEELADRPYIIEKSIDGTVWKEAARVKHTEFFDFLMDKNPPNPVRNVSAILSRRVEDTLINVTLNWVNPATALASDSPIYRVRSVNRIGFESEPSNSVGPIPFDTPIRGTVLRLKEYDGTTPSFSGGDATTLGLALDGATSFETIVHGNKKYTIALYVIDFAGNYSIASSIDIETPDNTKPIVPTILSVAEFSTMVN